MRSTTTSRETTTSVGLLASKLGDVCDMNPRRPSIDRDADAATTFVSMSAVAENGGGIVAAVARPFNEVRKGYTYFVEGDVLFAKITPCMQNGKHAVARNLIDGIGFGSTEFHVLRPHSGVRPEWVHLFLMQPSVLRDAQEHFTGSVGQQRVPEDYLADLWLPVPLPEDQDRILQLLRSQFEQISAGRAALGAQADLLDEMHSALLHKTFRVQP